MLDKAKLWDDFKALMAVEARGKNVSGNSSEREAFDVGKENKRAAWALERMEREEEFARIRSES